MNLSIGEETPQNISLKTFEIKDKKIKKDSKIYSYYNIINIEKIKNIVKYFEIIFIKNIHLLAFFISYFLYYLSLEGCHYGEEVCTKKIFWMLTKIGEEIISCIIMEIMIQLIIFKIISKKHLFHIIIIISILFFYSHGLDFPDHGYFNFLYFFIILSIFSIILLPFDIMIYCIKNKKISKNIIFIYIIIIAIIIIFNYFYFIVIHSNCEDWGKGLNNTLLENNITKYGCQIVLPTKCTYKIFGGIQNYTKIKGKDCKTYIKNGKSKLLKNSKSPYINEESNLIGYPLLNKHPTCLLDFHYKEDLLTKFTYNNLVDMENKTILNKYFKEMTPEVEIDFTNNNQGKIVINVNFNKTLSEERKLYEKNSTPYSSNILILYVDSVSRRNAMTQLKKTLSFFEKFVSYKGGFHLKYPNENFHSFQFFKYHSFLGNTQSNYPRLFYGQDKENKNLNLITKYLKENGYITSTAHDYCNRENTRPYHNYTYEEVFDHEYLLCDPNNDHINLNTIRCLYGKKNNEYLYEYTEQFWRKYSDNRKYSMIVSNEGHEGTLSVVESIDSTIYNFLNNLYNDNLLKDTTTFLLSDHGVSMPSVYWIFDFFVKETQLPMLFMIINDRKNISYEEQYGNIHENQQTFITGFDIYNTIGNIIYGDEYINIKNKTEEQDTTKSKYGISLFDYINPKERYPKKYSNHSKIYMSACI